MTEAKHQQPNLFTDPNFVGMSKDARHVVASLLVYTQHESDVPGLFMLSESQSSEANKATLDRFITYWADRVSASTSPSELLAELKVFGWLQTDVSRNLVRIPKAPLFMPPSDRGVAAKWATAIMRLPRCDLQDWHTQTLRQACSHDAELSFAFACCLVDGTEQCPSPYGE